MTLQHCSKEALKCQEGRKSHAFVWISSWLEENNLIGFSIFFSPFSADALTSVLTKINRIDIVTLLEGPIFDYGNISGTRSFADENNVFHDPVDGNWIQYSYLFSHLTKCIRVVGQGSQLKPAKLWFAWLNFSFSQSFICLSLQIYTLIELAWSTSVT